MNFTTIKAMFTTPSAEQLAVRELEQAKRELLQAQTQKEYWEQIVVYQSKRVARLESRK